MENELVGNGCYMFHNLETGEAYVGSTNNLELRRKAHIRDLKNGNHVNKRFQRAYDRNPNFDFVATPVESREVAFDLEQATIDEYYGQPFFLNRSKDARKCNVPGWKHTEEAKRKIGESRLGKPNGMLGKTLSPEHRAALLKSITGRTVSEETGKRISESLTGRKLSPEHAEKTRRLRLNVPHSEETRRKMSASHTGVKKSSEHAANVRTAMTAKYGKKVSVQNTVYGSINEAARALDVSPGTLHYRVNHPKHSEYSYVTSAATAEEQMC